MKQRNETVNALRSHLYEFGHVAPTGIGFVPRLARVVEDLRQALLTFQRTYNEHWLVERHGHRQPATIRREQTKTIQNAA